MHGTTEDAKLLAAMGLRRQLYRQLSVSGWEGRGVSPLNKVVMGLIVANLTLLVLHTEPVVREVTDGWLEVAEAAFVLVFSVEYALRVWVAAENPVYAGVGGRLRYVFSFFSILDLLSILPAYAGDLNSSGLRALRLLRVLRFARFGAFSIALSTVAAVFREKAYELTVSLAMTVTLLLVASTLMFFAEGDVQPDQFGSIPRALWWSVVTMTTVGYGDTYPVTPGGKVVAGLVALTSIAIVAVPTAILASAFVDAVDKKKKQRRGGRTKSVP